jgi:hypothetical protein
MFSRLCPRRLLLVFQFNVFLVIATVRSSHIVIAVLGKVCETETSSLFLVVRSDQTLAIAVLAADAVAAGISASARRHAEPGLDA